MTSMSINIGKPQPTATPAKSIEDLNGDGAINMLDIMLLASAFNTIKGSAGYNDKYDLDKNGAINMSDVLIVAAKFNQLAA